MHKYTLRHVYIHTYVHIHIHSHTNNHTHLSYDLPALPGTHTFPPGDLGSMCNEDAPRGFLPAVWLLKFVGQAVGGMLKSESDDQAL